MSPGCAASPSLPPLPIGHPMVVTPTPPEHRGWVQWWHQEMSGARLAPVPAAPGTGRICALCCQQSRQGEASWKLGREVWEPCRNAGLGAGACQAQMGSLVVVKIIQPLLKTQAQQPDPTAPVVAIPTGAVSVFASPAIPIHPWDLGSAAARHMPHVPNVQSPLQCQGEALSLSPCPRDEHPDPTPTPLLGEPHPCGCSHPLCHFLFLFECAQVSCLLF